MQFRYIIFIPRNQIKKAKFMNGEMANGEMENGEMANSPAFGEDLSNGDMRPRRAPEQ